MLQKKTHKRTYSKLTINSWSSVDILIFWGSGYRKINSLFNLINCQPDTDNIYPYYKDPCEEKYQFLINKQKSTSLNRFNDSKYFIEYSNDMDDI